MKQLAGKMAIVTGVVLTVVTLIGCGDPISPALSAFDRCTRGPPWAACRAFSSALAPGNYVNSAASPFRVGRA